jgi:nucleolin
MAEIENVKHDQEETQNKEDDQDVNSDEEGKSGELESNKRKRKRKRKKKSIANDAENAGIAGGTAGGSMAKNQDKLNSLEHTVYVEGIPFTCTEDEVKEFFISNGCEDVLQLRLPT